MPVFVWPSARHVYSEVSITPWDCSHVNARRIAASVYFLAHLSSHMKPKFAVIKIPSCPIFAAVPKAGPAQLIPHKIVVKTQDIGGNGLGRCRGLADPVQGRELDQRLVPCLSHTQLKVEDHCSVPFFAHHIQLTFHNFSKALFLPSYFALWCFYAVAVYYRHSFSLACLSSFGRELIVPSSDCQPPLLPGLSGIWGLSGLLEERSLGRLLLSGCPWVWMVAARIPAPV